MLNKKGAMFGLDARIALAIFGALSVISGAALYSAIQQSKAVAMVNSLEEIGKAIDSYRLDTGVVVPKMNTSTSSHYFYALQSHELVDNTLSTDGWKGPYLSYSKAAGTGSLNNVMDHPEYGSIWILTLTNEATFGDGVGNWTGAKCTTGKACYLYVVVNRLETDDLAKAMDKVIDGGDGGEAGRMRWYYESASVKYNYFYQYSVVENPND